MSIDNNSYIGPYLKVTVEIKTKLVDKCQDHDFPKNAKYCPVCGTPTLDRIVEIIEDGMGWEHEPTNRITLVDWFYTTSSVCPPETYKKGGKEYQDYIYLPNKHRKKMGLPEIADDRYGDDCEVPFDNLDIPGCLTKFKELFKKPISMLEERYCKVEIKYGYVSYCS